MAAPCPDHRGEKSPEPLLSARERNGRISVVRADIDPGLRAPNIVAEPIEQGRLGPAENRAGVVVPGSDNRDSS